MDFTFLKYVIFMEYYATQGVFTIFIRRYEDGQRFPGLGIVDFVDLFLRLYDSACKIAFAALLPCSDSLLPPKQVHLIGKREISGVWKY